MKRCGRIAVADYNKAGAGAGVGINNRVSRSAGIGVCKPVLRRKFKKLPPFPWSDRLGVHR